MNIMQILEAIAHNTVTAEIEINAAFPVKFDDLNAEMQTTIKDTLTNNGVTINDLTQIDVVIKYPEITTLSIFIHYISDNDPYGAGNYINAAMTDTEKFDTKKIIPLK